MLFVIEVTFRFSGNSKTCDAVASQSVIHYSLRYVGHAGARLVQEFGVDFIPVPLVLYVRL